MKIRKAVLGDRSIVEQDGQFVEQIENEKTIPLYLTNYALKYGHDSGLFTSSALSQIVKDDYTDEQVTYKLLYVAAVGANPAFPEAYTYEKFVEKLLISPNRLMYLAQTVLNDALPDEFEEWESQLAQLTVEPNSKKK